MVREIRKAALLAAGRGTRLGALTANTPKPMLEVAGAPLIEQIVTGLAEACVTQFVVVTGYLGEHVERWARDFGAAHPELQITTVRQSELNGTAGALLAARSQLEGERRFLFGWGDVLMDRTNYARFIERAQTEGYDLMLAVNRVRDPYRGAAVYVAPDMRVERLVEKPPKGKSTTTWNNAGLFASGQILFDYLARLHPSARGELELPEAIAAMIKDGRRVIAFPSRGFWTDVGTPEDLDQARARFRPELRQS